MVLKAYGDESGKRTAGGERVIALGALIAENSQWAVFEQQWAAMLAHWEVPYLHMKEIQEARLNPDRPGPFSHLASDMMKVQSLLHGAVKVIVDTGLIPRSMAVFTDDLEEVMVAHKVAADPFAFTLYIAVGMLGTWALNKHPDDPSFELVLDRLEKGHKRVAEAQDLYESDEFMAWRGWPIVTPLSPNNGPGSKDIFGLQAADLVAWVTRFQCDNIKQWTLQVKPTLEPLNFKQWSESMFEFLARRRVEQSEKFPWGVVFNSTFARLVHYGGMEFYFFDKERLEGHIFASRSKRPDTRIIDYSIAKSGRARPLSA